MSEFPEIPPIPAGFKWPPFFSLRAFLTVYENSVKRADCTKTEIAAHNLGLYALCFLTGSQPAPGSDYIVAEETTPPHIKVFTWMNRTQPLLDYLDAYLAEVRREGTPEQIEFLRDILDRPAHEDESQSCPINDDEDDSDEVDSFPEPSQAITIIERIAQSHASTSIEYVALQITIRAIQHLIESGEAPEFMRYVDQMSKWEPPSVE